MIVVAAAVLILNDKLRAVLPLSDDVDATSSRGRYFRAPRRGKVNADSRAELIETLDKQGSEVGSLTLPRLGQSPVGGPPHPRHRQVVTRSLRGRGLTAPKRRPTRCGGRATDTSE